MCVAVPGRVEAVTDAGDARVADVAFGPVTREVDLVFTPEAGVGDWVIVHSGYALRVVSADAAVTTLAILEGLDAP